MEIDDGSADAEEEEEEECKQPTIFSHYNQNHIGVEIADPNIGKKRKQEEDAYISSDEDVETTAESLLSKFTKKMRVNAPVSLTQLLEHCKIDKDEKSEMNE